MTTATHHVKVREIGKKAWHFLGSGGGVTRLRVHALQFTEERANALIAENKNDNPDWEWKVVSVA